MPTGQNDHIVARPGTELRGFGYSKAANFAALPASGQAGEIVTATASGDNYYRDQVAGRWRPFRHAEKLYPFLKTSAGVVSAALADDITTGRLVVGDCVRVLAYTQGETVGGGDYLVVAAGTGTDDGGSFVNVGSLQLQGFFEGSVPVTRFGAKGQANSTTAINAARTYANANGMSVYFPSLRKPASGYQFNGPMTLVAGEVWVGDGIDQTIIGALGGSNGIVLNNHCRLEGFTLTQALTSVLQGTGIVTNNNAARYAIRDVRVQLFDTGVNLTNTWIGLWQNLHVISVNVGVDVGSLCTTQTFIGGEWADCDVAALRMDYALDVLLEGVVFEANAGVGVLTRSNTFKSFTLRNCYFEEHAAGSIRIGGRQNSAVLIESCMFSRDAADTIRIEPDGAVYDPPLDYGVHPGSDCIRIATNTFLGNDAGSPGRPIYIGPNAQRTIIGLNKYHQDGAKGYRHFDPDLDDDGQNTFIEELGVKALLPTATYHFSGADYNSGSTSWVCRRTGSSATVASGAKTSDRRGVVFDGSATQVLLPAAASPDLTAGKAATVLVYATLPSVAVDTAVFSTRTGSASTSVGFALMVTAAGVAEFYGHDGTTTSANTTPSISTTKQLMGGSFSAAGIAVMTTDLAKVSKYSTDLAFRGTGYPFDVSSRSALTYVSGNPINIGREPTSTAARRPMTVYDVIVFDRVLTWDELLRLPIELEAVTVSDGAAATAAPVNVTVTGTGAQTVFTVTHNLALTTPFLPSSITVLDPGGNILSGSSYALSAPTANNFTVTFAVAPANAAVHTFRVTA